MADQADGAAVTGADVQLTAGQIERFSAEGYLSVPALTTQSDVAELRDIYDRLFDRKVGRELGLQFDLAGLDDDGSEAVSEEVLPHRSLNDDNRIHANELRPEFLHHAAGAVPCPLPPGGATFHGGYTLHYTGPNRSSGPRRAIILYAGVPPTKRAVPRDQPWMRARATERAKRAAEAKAAVKEML